MDEVLREEKTGLHTQSRGVLGKRGARVALDQSIKIKTLAKMGDMRLPRKHCLPHLWSCRVFLRLSPFPALQKGSHSLQGLSRHARYPDPQAQEEKTGGWKKMVGSQVSTAWLEGAAGRGPSQC